MNPDVPIGQVDEEYEACLILKEEAEKAKAKDDDTIECFANEENCP